MPMTKEVTIQDVFDRFLPEMAEVSTFHLGSIWL